MVYSNNDQKIMPATKSNAVSKKAKDNFDVQKYNMKLAIGKYIPHITSGCVFVKYSRY